MAGSVTSGKKAAITNKKKYGDSFYALRAKESQRAWEENGRKPRGFAANRERASWAGRIGGTNSKRKGVKNKQRITTPVVVIEESGRRSLLSVVKGLFAR